MISSTTDGTRSAGARPRASGASRATTETASRLTNSTSGIGGSSHGRASTADVTEGGEQDGLRLPGEGLDGDLAESGRGLRHLLEVCLAARTESEVLLEPVPRLLVEHVLEVVRDQLHELLAGHARDLSHV